MNQNDPMTHPIAPPPELVQEWWEQADQYQDDPRTYFDYVATEAAQWGADQELEACCEWVSKYLPYLGDFPMPEDKLRARRRPKPPSLKEEALGGLDQLAVRLTEARVAVDLDTIRRALEALPE